jgi:hypothetical protein
MVTNGELKYYCTGCDRYYLIPDKDTKIYSSDLVKPMLIPTGDVIYHNPSNPKIKKKCPKCPYQVVAFQMVTSTKIYGCRCKATWAIGISK